MMHENDNQNIHRENMYTLIRRSSFYMLIERSIAPIINFLVTIYIVRNLSINEFGIYNILLAVMGYVALFSSFGLPHIFQRYIPEFYQKKEIAKLKRLVELGLLWRFLLCCGIISILLLFSEQLGKLFKFGGASQYLAIFSVAIVFYLEANLVITFLTSIFQHKNYVKAQLAYVLFRAGLLYYLLENGKGLKGLLITESVAYGFLLIFLIFYYRRFLLSHITERKTKLPMKRLLRYGGFSYLDEVGGQVLDVSTDVLIISAFLGPIAVGIYAFANRVMKLTTHVLPQFVFMKIIRPVFFTRYTQDIKPDQINKMFNFIIKIIAFFVFPLITAIIILGDKLIMYVFDPKYLGSLQVLWIVATFTALNFFMFPTGLVLQSKEKVQILFISKIFAIYNLVGDLLVVNTYGVVGVALVTGSAVLFKNLFCYFFAKKYTALSPDFKGLGKIVFNSFFMGFLIYQFRGVVVNLVSFILIAFLGLSIYILCAFISKAFNEDERKIMNKILPKPVFIF